MTQRLTYQQARHELGGISKSTLHRLLREGKLHAIYISSGCPRIEQSTIDEYLDSLRYTDAAETAASTKQESIGCRKNANVKKVSTSATTRPIGGRRGRTKPADAIADLRKLAASVTR